MSRKANININRLQHIGIPVSSLERTIPFYLRLGFEVLMDRPFDHVEGHGRCVMMQQRDIMLEFYQLPESVIHREVLTREDGHIDHIAFDVKDILGVYNVVKNAGFEPLQDTPVFLDFWESGVKFFHITGPDGERIEFNEIL